MKRATTLSDTSNEQVLQVPEAFASLFLPNSDTHKRKRFYVRYGGRASGKSWQFATLVVLRMYTGREFVVCAREVWKTMAESVHRVLVSRIEALGLLPYFKITDNSINCPHTGSEAIFKGLGANVKENIKSLEGSTICWIDEADDVSKYSWTILLPTVLRTHNSELLVSFNTGLETDETYQRFVVKQDPARMDVRKVNHSDNPYLPEGVREQMEADKIDDYDLYLNTWEGFPLKAKDGGVFKPEKMNIVPAVPAGCRWVRGWDMASSAVIPGKDPDWTVGFKLGYNPDTERYIIGDVLRFRGRPEEVEASLITTTKNDGLDVQQDIPTDPGSAGVFAVTNFVKKLAGYRVATSLETGSKLVRAEVLASQVNVGNVDMLYAPWNDVVIQELKAFNGSGKNQKDDIADAASRAFARLRTPQFMTRIKIW